MDPYTPTWLAQHPVPLAIAAVQLAVALGALWQRRWGVAAALLGAAAAVAVWLGPSWLALWSHDPLPYSGWGPVALAAPFVAITAVALARMRPPDPLKLRSVIGFALFGHGLAAWAMALILIVSGQLQSPRGKTLAAGLVTWAASDVVHHQRYALRSMVPLGDTGSIWTVGAVEAGLAATAWVAVGTWMLAAPAPGVAVVDERAMSPGRCREPAG